EATSGKKVNLERAILSTSRLDGHLVYGHIDDIGEILCDKEMNGSIRRTIEVPDHLMIFMAEKGSVAVDGISLTIATLEENKITISLVPHTLKMTTMSLKKSGDFVNIECDIVARYLHRFFEKVEKIGNKREPLTSLLERCGF
ncbi:MAG: riboflavin synthase, partial [Chitinispirillaceae bacterium]|nr:riboflavin synthase [Chitinispirillaceae bacterium]